MAVPETSVLKRIASGDLDAMRACIDQYGALIWSLARRLTRSAADAEDATQEIFTHIWRNAARFDETKGSERIFVAIIARRRLIDRLRKSRLEQVTDSSIELADGASWSDPGADAEVSYEARSAMQVLEALRPEQRQVLELGLLHGLTQVEIASRLEVPLGTVKSNMRRGILRLREAMKTRESGSGGSHG